MLSTTTRISGLSLAGNGWSKNFAYTYDANGNISSITENGETVGSYLYDSHNQLTYANHNGKTYSYMYDKGGNILSKTENGITKTYSYGDSTWKDLLTSYNGNAITYDTIGNPLTYYDGKTFDWDGRQLKSVGTGTTYKYNADGIRTEKTTSGMTTRFYLNGSQIIASQNNYGFTYYDYDATGKVISTVYFGNTYYYVYNLQGDVIGITNSAGELVVEYTYDPWGKVTGLSGSEMSGIGLNNPFRYRGYYYDTETGFYYVSSRYYDPEIGRWISPEPNVYAGEFDSGSGFVGYNVYAYCANNPVFFADPTGEAILTAIVIGVIVGAVIGGSIGGTVAYNSAKSSGLEGSDLFWATAGGVGKGMLFGGIAGGLIGATAGVIAAPAYAASSFAVTATVTTTLTVTAKTTEVIVLQTEKSKQDGDNNWQIANDCIDSLYNNSATVFSPIPTKAITGTASYYVKDFNHHKVIPLGVSTFFYSTSGGRLAYVSAAVSWWQTSRSIYFRDNPIEIASQRGYTLV